MRASVAALGHPARMDWQPLSNNEKFIYTRQKQTLRQVQECMASAVIECLAYAWDSMGSIPTIAKICKNLEIRISGTRVRIQQGSCW